MTSIYDDPRLYERQTLPVNHWTDVLDAVIEAFDVKRAVDLGCGLGIDVCMMLDAGLDVYGIDGDERMREHVLFPPERYVVRDLTDALVWNADLVWCREVAEHLDPCWAGRLVRNIIESGRVVYFTAAAPGQIGFQHINCKPRSYWQQQFRDRGWKVHRELTKLCGFNPNPDDATNGMVLCQR